MRLVVAVLACALASCAAAKSTALPSGPSSAAESAENGESAPTAKVQAQVEALNDPAKRRVAVQRLWQLWEDALTNDDKNRGGPNAGALRDAISDPLDRLCLDPAVESRTRSSVVKLVADLRDPRTEACFKKTLEDYAPDATEEDVQAVLRAVAALRLKSLAPEVMKVFTRREFARTKVALLKSDLTDAVMAVVGPAQEGELVKLLDAPMRGLEQAAGRNQAFWQTVTARALGEIRSEKAARPLIKVILTPGKAVVASTAMVAVVKIGKPSIAPAEKLLREEDTELVAYEKEQAPFDRGQGKAGKLHVQRAAEILAALGSESSTGPLVAALAKAKNEPETRLTVAVALTQLPRSEAGLSAFKRTFEEMAYGDDTGAGNAKERLAEASSDFFDPSLASYLVKATTDAASKRAPAEGVHSARQAALMAAIKLMGVAELPEVEKLANIRLVERGPLTVGHSVELELKQAKALLGACKEGMDCYFAALTDAKSQTKEKQFTGIKAAFMIGSLGRESDRARLYRTSPMAPCNSPR